jgi:hypothetical protein
MKKCKKIQKSESPGKFSAERDDPTEGSLRRVPSEDGVKVA